MALSPLPAAIAAGLEAHGIIVAAKVFEGEEHLHEHADYPRVVFVPGTVGKDQFGPTNRPGGNARQRATAFDYYDVHCWAVDYAAARELRSDVAAQCIESAGGMSKDSLLFGSGGFTQKTLHEQRGKEYVFSIRFAAPIQEAAYPTAPASVSATHVCKMKFPSSEHIEHDPE